MRRALVILGRVRDWFPLTWLGLLVAAASAFAFFYYGLARIDLLLLIGGMVGLVLTGLTALLVLGTALALYFRLRGRRFDQPFHAECGYARRTGFEVPSLWFVPFIRVGWSWTGPKVHLVVHRRGLRLHEEIAPVERALRDGIRRRFEVSDAFGFARISFELWEERPLRFVPSVGNLRQVHVIRSMAEGDQLSHPEGPPRGERVDMRHYVPGDPIRFILWKVFAKSREVVVRTPERALGPVHQTVAYLVRGELDEPAAGAARVAIESGAFHGDWVVGADGCDAAAKTPREALELLAQSGEADLDTGGRGLSAFLREQTPGSLGRALVFVPGRPGPWLDRLQATARGAANLPRVDFMVCSDGVDRAKPRGLLAPLRFDRRVLDPRKGVGSVASAELAEVCQRLASLGHRVTVLDRLSGHVHSGGMRSGLLAGGKAA